GTGRFDAAATGPPRRAGVPAAAIPCEFASMRNGRSTWAVLPVKDLAGAQQRLAGVLGAAERRDLFAAMLEDVLGALAASGGLAGVLVVTRDPLAQDLAAR